MPDGDAAMKTVFSTNTPLIEFCDRSTDSGANTQKGFMEDETFLLNILVIFMQ